MKHFDKVKRETMKAYHRSICNEVIEVVRAAESTGVDVMGCISDVTEIDWQCPPIEAGIRGVRRSGGIFTDLKGVLKGLRKKEDKFLATWKDIAAEVLSGETAHVGASYKGIAEALMVAPDDAALIFCTPDDFGSDTHLTIFALETAAYLQAAYDLEVVRANDSMYVYWQGSKVGVAHGEVFIDEPVGVQVSQASLDSLLRLPRGRTVRIPTRDTIDALRAWSITAEIPDPDFFLDCLSILKLGASSSLYRYLNLGLMALKPAGVKSSTRFEKRKMTLAAKYGVSLQERSTDYEKVQDLMGDSSIVDRAKLYGAMEILVPKYMTPNTFRTYLGYATVKGEHAMFTKEKAKKMMDGWTKFRDVSLAKAKEKLEKSKEQNG